MTTQEIIIRIQNLASNVDSPELGVLAAELSVNMTRLSSYVTQAATLLSQDAFCDAAQTIRDGKISAEVAVLEQFEIQTWNELCDLKGYTMSPVVDPTDVKLLLSFLQQYEASEELFRRHRRLSLERADLNERLNVIYELQKRFESQVWTRMIARLEQLRDQQIVESLAQLTEENVRFDLIDQFRFELTRPDRVSKPRGEAVAAVNRWYDLVAKREARASLLQLISEWEGYLQNKNDARVLNCYDRYMRDMQRFSSLLPKEDLARLDKLVTVGKTLRMNADAIEEFNRKQRAFETILQHEYDIDKIEDAYAALEIAASKSRLQIPPAIIRAYEEKIDAFRRQEQRKRLMLVMSIVVAACVLMAGIVALAKSVRNHAFAKETTARLNTLVEKFTNTGSYPTKERYDALEEARKLVEERQNDKRLLAYKEWRPTFERYDDVRGKEDTRHDKFLKAAAELERIIDDGKTSSTKMRDLQSKAVTSEEIDLLNDIHTRHSALITKATGSTVNSYTDGLNELKDLYAQATAKNVSLQDCEKICRDALGRLSALEAKEKIGLNIPKGNIAERERLSALFKNRLGQLEYDDKANTISSELDEAMPDATKYQEALEQGVETFTKELNSLQDQADSDEQSPALEVCSQRLSELNNAQNAMQTHQVIDQWNQTMQGLLEQMPWNLDAEHFKKAQSIMNGFDTNARKTAPPKLIPEWRALADTFAATSGSTNGVAGEWEEFCKALGAYAQPCWVRRDVTGLVYLYYDQEDGGGRYTDFKGPGETSSEEINKKPKGDAVESASHTLASIVMLAQDDVSVNGNLEFLYHRTVLECLNTLDQLCPAREGASKDVSANDPILILCLFNLVLGNAPELPQLQEWYNWIDQECKVDYTFNFDVNPFNLLEEEEYERARSKAKMCLRKRPKTLPELEDPAEFSNDVELAQYVWVGILELNKNGRLEVKKHSASEEVAPKNAEFFVLDAAQKSLVSIGAQGVELPQLLTDRPNAVRRWTPVYARKVLTK